MNQQSSKAQKAVFTLLTVIAVFSTLGAVSATANVMYNMFAQDKWSYNQPARW